MAITPVALTRTWYSLGNVPYTPTSADDCQKWFLWLWKELLIGNYAGKGGDVGPEGARPASSFWTVVGSNDGVGNFSSGGPVGDTNNDGVDRWASKANVIFANSGTNHSWIILKSPVATNPNGALGFGQGPMWMLLDNSADAGTAVISRAKIMFSREPFTGGTATARPTSPKEFNGAMYLNTNLAPQIWTNTTYNVIRRMSISVDANGQFYMCTVVSATGVIESSHCLVENINSDDRDLYRQHATLCYFGHPGALVSRRQDGAVQRYANAVSNAAMSTSGGLIRWVFGLDGGTAQSSGIINGLSAGYVNGNPNGGVTGSNPSSFGSVVSLDISGYVTALPLYVLDYNGGHSGNVGSNRPEWRGQLPDSWAINSNNNLIVDGSSYPNAAAQTHVVTSQMLTLCSKFLIPMSVQLAL